MKKKITYYTWAHNIEGCLRNGSLVRRTKYGLGQFMNGDFMGFIEAVPEGMTEVETKYAVSLLPSCFK